MNNNNDNNNNTQNFWSVIRPRFGQKFQLIGKDAEVLICNKTTVQYNYEKLIFKNI